MISDREFKGPFFPNTHPVSCWNHLAQNLEFHARTVRKLPEEYRRSLNSNLYALLKSSSEERYEQRKTQFFQQPQWTPEMQSYFNRYQDDDIKTRAAAYVLERAGLPEPTRGITNNAAESLNNVFRKLRSKTNPRPKASLILSLRILEDNVDMEVRRAYHGEGSLSIIEERKEEIQKSPFDIPAMDYKSYDYYMNKMAAAVAKAEREEKNVEKESQVLIGSNPEVPVISLLAKDIVDRDAIRQTEMGGSTWYHVTGRDKQIFNVSVDTKNPRCTCGSRSVCAHMLAVRHAIGLQSDFGVPPEFKKAYEKSLPKVPKRGTKKPKRTDTIHESVAGTEPVTIRQKKMHLRVNDPRLDSIAEGDEGNAEQDQQDNIDVERDLVDNPPTQEAPDEDDIFIPVPDFSQGLPRLEVLENYEKQVMLQESPTTTQEAMNKFLEAYDLKDLEAPEDMEGIGSDLISDMGSLHTEASDFIMEEGGIASAIDEIEHMSLSGFVHEALKTPAHGKEDEGESQKEDDISSARKRKMSESESNLDNSKRPFIAPTATITRTTSDVGDLQPFKDATETPTLRRTRSHQAGYLPPLSEAKETETSEGALTKVPPQRTISSMLKNKMLIKEKTAQEIRMEKYEKFREEEEKNLIARTKETLGQQVAFQGEVDMADDVCERDVRLLENQYRVFVKTTSSGEKKDVMAVKRIKNKAYAFIPKGQHLTKECMGLAAYSVASAATTKEDRAKIVSNEMVSVCQIKVDNVRVAAEEANAKSVEKIRGKQIKLSDCYCSKPLTDDDSTVVCRSCGKSFHYSCAGNPTDAQSWNCDKHKIRLRGAHWAENQTVTNTCPIDNHLTMLAELGARSQQFLDLFHTEHANDQAWHKSLLLAVKQQYAEAQSNWADHFRLDNFEGSPAAEVISKLKCINFQRTSQCDNDACPMPFTVIEVNPEIMLSVDGTDTKQDFKNLVTGHISAQCQVCKEGITDIGPMEPANPKKPPPMFELDNAFQTANFESLTALPKEVTLGAHTYERKMVVMHTPSIRGNESGHFYAFMNFDGHWLHYDGLDKTKEKRFNPVKPKQYLNNQITSSVTYTLKMDDN